MEWTYAANLSSGIILVSNGLGLGVCVLGRFYHYLFFSSITAASDAYTGLRITVGFNRCQAPVTHTRLDISWQLWEVS